MCIGKHNISMYLIVTVKYGLTIIYTLYTKTHIQQTTGCYFFNEKLPHTEKYLVVPKVQFVGKKQRWGCFEKLFFLFF